MERSISIYAEKLCIGYGSGRKSTIVHPSLDFELYSGETVCLLGLNGAGKSTLLRTLCGFQAPLSGSIRIFGKDFRDYRQHDLAQLIGAVLTDRTNAGGLSVRELVSLGRQPHTGFFGHLKESDEKTVDEALSLAGIEHKAACPVSQLSDGEKQKAFIAKALAQECPIIILDEPTAFLDVAGRISTFRLLKKLSSENGKTVLLSTHDLDMARRFADRMLLLRKDSDIICGTPEDLSRRNCFEEFFGAGA